ncbi:MAG TPA: M23 family metallopeptidase [Gaiellaceae bacterium]|nr:M23 family metallopeptidase [Gaiellaceae bacterium]
MGRARWLAAAVAAALVCVAPAAAMTDGGVGLSLQWPADGVVTRGFGWDPTMGEEHAGIDIGTLRSLDVHAAAPGVVEAAGYAPGFDGYGEVVLVRLGYGLEALYAHLPSVRVAAGETVWAGELLGEAGCTGYCTGTHLHFELRDDGVAFDPSPLLPATLP